MLEFIASNGDNKVSAASATEAVHMFLSQYKNRKFVVKEYRDGKHVMMITLDRSQRAASYLFKRFNTRQEAFQWLQDEALKITMAEAATA